MFRSHTHAFMTKWMNQKIPSVLNTLKNLINGKWMLENVQWISYVYNIKLTWTSGTWFMKNYHFFDDWKSWTMDTWTHSSKWVVNSIENKDSIKNASKTPIDRFIARSSVQHIDQCLIYFRSVKKSISYIFTYTYEWHTLFKTFYK